LPKVAQLPARPIPGIEIASADERGDLFAAIAVKVFHDKPSNGPKAIGEGD